jgi:glycosyltransferase involved in cell wall biosynthesis
MTKSHRLRILVLTKRQYTHKDLIDDRFGRIREIPLHLARKGHSVKGLCLSYRRRKGGAFQDEGVPWESINAGPLFVGGSLRFVLRAMRFAREADAIWACSDSIFGIIGLFISRAIGIPVVFDLYDNFESFILARLPLFQALYRHAVRRCDAVTAVSRPLLELVHSYGRTEGLHLIENAVDRKLFWPHDKEHCRSKFKLPHRARIIGTAGALFKNRGIETLFKSFMTLAEKHPDVHLAIAGPRDVRIPVHPRIHDMGSLEYHQVPLFLSTLDVGIICNRAGAFGTYCFPQKAREMMACNVPMVAANVAGTRSLLSDHPEWLFQPEDSGHLAQIVENRLRDQSTEYGSILTWSDLSDKLTVIFQALTDRSERAVAEGAEIPKF